MSESHPWELLDSKTMKKCSGATASQLAVHSEYVLQTDSMTLGFLKIFEDI